MVRIRFSTNILALLWSTLPQLIKPMVIILIAKMSFFIIRVLYPLNRNGHKASEFIESQISLIFITFEPYAYSHLREAIPNK